MSLESLSVAILVVGFLALVVVVVAVVRHAPRSRGADALAGGDFEAALAATGEAGSSQASGPEGSSERGAAAASDDGSEREDLFAAAFAAKHLLRLGRAAELLDRILAADPEDGEAWLERGLVHAYSAAFAGSADAPAAEPEPGAEPSPAASEVELERALEALTRAEALRSDLAESIALHRAWVELRRGRRNRARRLFDDIQIPLETKLRLDLGPGDPVFSEWFLHAGDLWRATGRHDAAAWAHAQALEAAPRSRLVQSATADGPTRA